MSDATKQALRSIESGHRSLASQGIDALVSEIEQRSQPNSVAESGLWTAASTPNRSASAALKGLVRIATTSSSSSSSTTTNNNNSVNPIARLVSLLPAAGPASALATLLSRAKATTYSLKTHPLIDADMNDVLSHLAWDAVSLKQHTPLLRHVLLNPTRGASSDAAHLINELMHVLDESPDVASVLPDILLEVVASSPALKDYPLDLDMFAILDGLSRHFNEFSHETQSNMILAALSLVSDLSSSSSVSLYRPLRLLDRLLAQTTKSDAFICIISVFACQLLLDSTDLDKERLLILNLLQRMLGSLKQLECVELAHNVIACSVYPLTCVISEVSNKANPTLRRTAFEVLAEVTSLLSSSARASNTSINTHIDDMTAELALLTKRNPGSLGPLFANVSTFITATLGIHLSTYFSASQSVYAPLLLTSFLFHTSEPTCLSAISLLESLITTTSPITPSTPTSPTTIQSKLALSLLPTTLYLLKTSPSAEVQHKLLTSFLPSLVRNHSDAHVTTAVLRVITTFLGPLTAPSVNTASPVDTTPALTSTAIRVLVEVWKVQPRVWGHLKNVLAGWVVRKRNRSVALKRFGKRGDDVGGDGIYVEVAISAAIHEICSLKARECGEDLLPIALSLLEMGGEMLVFTRSLALETINLCIDADITDPRAIYNVHHSAYIKALRTTPSVPPILWLRICKYFSLVPKKTEDTEAYQTFHTEILTVHLLPMLATTTLPPEVRSAAYTALSSFSPPDLYPYLPEPPEYIPTLLTEPSTGTSALITSLLTHEISNMRRAVFKAIATDMGVNRTVLSSDTETERELSKAKRVLKDVGGDIREKWSLGKGAAAVRGGMSAAVLYLPVGLLPDELKGNVVDMSAPFARTSLYKDLVNGLRDVSISDHAVIRVEACSVWVSFWTARFRAVGGDDRPKKVDWLFTSALEELEKRLKEARQPGSCATLLCSLAGLVSAGVVLGIPAASEQVTRVIKLLQSGYARPYDGTEASDLQKSDEVQFAVCMSLSQLSKLVGPTDESSFEIVISQLKSELENAKSDDAQSGFAAGFGLVVVLHTLVQSASPITHLIQRVFAIVKGVLLDPSTVSSVAFVGVSMGIANCLREVKEYFDGEGAAEELHACLQKCVERFMVTVGNVDVGTVSGDCWVISGVLQFCPTIIGDDDEQLKVIQALGGLVERSESEPNLLTLSNIAYNRVLVSRQSTQEIYDILEATLQRLSKSSYPSPTRVAAALSLTPLLGIDLSTSIFTDALVFRKTVETLHSAYQSSLEPKVSRILGWVLGKTFAAFETFYDSEAVTQLDALLQISNGGTSFAQSRRKDPVDYRRLNAGSSFLRAVFDSLSGLCSNGTIEEKDYPAAEMLMTGLVAISEGPKALGLPIVNWTKVLNACTDSKSQDLKRLAFELASVHSSHVSAKSLVDYFVSKLGSFAELRAVKKMAFGEEGVGKLLELSGLCQRGEQKQHPDDDESRGMSITVAPSKVLEIVQALVYYVYFEGGEGTTKNKIQLAEVIHKSLSQTCDGVPESLLKLKIEIIGLLCDGFNAIFPYPDTADKVLVVRRLTHTLLTTPTQESTASLNSILLPDTWSPKHIWALLHALEFGDQEAPWVISQINKQFVNRDHLIVRILQYVVSAPETQLQGPTSCLAAVMTYLRSVSLKFQSVERTHEEIVAFKVTWVVRYLDVLIIACAAENGEGVDFGWGRCLSGGLLALGIDEGLRMEQTELFGVSDAEWSVVETRINSVLINLLVGQSDKRITSLRTQVIKRLLRLLECCTTEEKKEKKPKDPRVLISTLTFGSIRDLLLRLRDFDEVADNWIEVVGEI